MSFANRKIKIKAKTWTRDSYGLYDYETTNYHLQNFDICKAGRIIRSNNEIVCHPHNAEGSETLTQVSKNNSPEVMEFITSISQSDEGIKIETNLPDGDESCQTWMAVGKKTGTSGYPLQENDIIKLGRIKIRVKQIILGTEQNSAKSPNDFILDSIREYMTTRDGKQCQGNTQCNEEGPQGPVLGATCKICLGEKGEENDPLISPCKCIGSVKYVHLKCLQNWVKSKLNIEQAQKIISIYWKNLSCELCKADLPLYLKYQEQELLLLPLESKTTGPYVILESFSKEKDPFGIHMIDLSLNHTFRIGRSHDCDLRFGDISVSRIHAMLKISHGKLYLKDNYSKFGTLVLLKEPILLNDNHCKSPWLQCGRTIFRVSLKKPWAIVLPCLGTIFGTSKVYEAKNNPDSERKKTEIPRERFFTNYEDI